MYSGAAAPVRGDCFAMQVSIRRLSVACVWMSSNHPVGVSNRVYCRLSLTTYIPWQPNSGIPPIINVGGNSHLKWPLRVRDTQRFPQGLVFPNSRVGLLQIRAQTTPSRIQARQGKPQTGVHIETTCLCSSSERLLRVSRDVDAVVRMRLKALFKTTSPSTLSTNLLQLGRA